MHQQTRHTERGALLPCPVFDFLQHPNNPQVIPHANDIIVVRRQFTFMPRQGQYFADSSLAGSLVLYGARKQQSGWFEQTRCNYKDNSGAVEKRHGGIARGYSRV